MMGCTRCGQPLVAGQWGYNDRRQPVCRGCYEAIRTEQGQAIMRQHIDERRVWYRVTDRFGGTERIDVTVVDVKGGWLIVRDEATGRTHRVREHNTKRA